MSLSSAKYPLAVIDHVVNTLSKNITCGYDIGCKLESTIERSLLLANKVAEANFRLVVPAFHAYAHN